MKAEFNRHGARISEQEYNARVVAAHTGHPPMPSKEQSRQARRAEMEAHIDHNLGVDFPAHRREQMWGVVQEIEREAWRIPFLCLTDAFKALFIKKDLVPTEAHWSAMAGYAAKKYGKVLDEEEIEAFLHLKEDGIVPKP